MRLQPQQALIKMISYNGLSRIIFHLEILENEVGEPLLLEPRMARNYCPMFLFDPTNGCGFIYSDIYDDSDLGWWLGMKRTQQRKYIKAISSYLKERNENKQG